MPALERSIYIDGPAQAIYAMGKKIEDYPQFMPDVENVKILERRGNKTVSEWITNVEGTPIIWKEEDTFHDDALQIDYKLIEGDLEKFEGSWRFISEGSGTKVILTVDFDFGMPSLTELIGPTLELKVKENCDMMLKAMKSKMEGKARV